MFVIIALAGLFQLPPSRSEYCAADGAHTTSTNSIKKRPRLDCELFLLIESISCFVEMNFESYAFYLSTRKAAYDWLKF